MAVVEPEMLWEATDAEEALRRRFGFESAAEVETWLRTDAGRLIAKSCGWAMLHARLAQVADLLVWLAGEGLPVAVPLAACDGARQVMADRRSLGLLRWHGLDLARK